MEQNGRKKRDRFLLLLLLLLFIVAVTGIYFHFFPYNSVKKTQSVSTIGNNIRRSDSIALSPADSGINLMIDSADKYHINKSDTSSGPVEKTEGHNKKNENDEDEAGEDDDEIEDFSPEELKKIIGKKKELLSVSEDEDVLALYDPQRKTLNVRPVNSEWGIMYLIYPNPDYRAVLRRNLMFPDFEGLVYPDYKKGQLSYNGGKQDAVAVKIKATADRDHSFTIQAKNNPKFFIFGDFENRKAWYIYEKGKVRKFKPTDTFDARLKEKL